jgi:hypothetical protein
MKNLIISLIFLSVFSLLPAQEDNYEEVGNYNKIVEGIAYEARNADNIMWIVDRSPSMEDDVKAITERVKKLLRSLKNKGKVPNGIVTFSDKPRLHLKPTVDVELVEKRFSKIKMFGAGKETLYAAISLAIKQKSKGKESFFIVVTDETGDDPKIFESVLKSLIKKNIHVLVLSPNASFGNKTWHWNSPDIAAKNTQFFNSQNGPSSGTQELLFDFTFIQRSTWSDTINPMEQRVWAIKAGWAPYGLQRMADETGGKVFELETDTCMAKTPPFKRKDLYKPDFSSLKTIKKHIRKHPWRKAVDEANNLWEKILPLDREFNGTSKTVLINGIQNQMTLINNNLKICNKVIKILHKALSKKPQSSYLDEEENENFRWRANIELDFAMALVMRYHVHQFLKDFQRFKAKNFWPDPQKNVCQFNILIVPDNKKFFSASAKNTYDVSGSGKSKFKNMLLAIPDPKTDQLKEMRLQAEKALYIVRENHPDTPWFSMAFALQRILGNYDIYINPCGNWSNSTGNQ